MPNVYLRLVISGSLGLLACTPQQISQQTTVVLSETLGSRVKTDFSALGGAGLDPTVQRHCSGGDIRGEQGYAEATARQYRAYLKQLLTLTSGGQQRQLSSAYGISPVAFPSSSPVLQETPAPGPSFPPSTEDISTIEKTTLNGLVLDSSSAPLDGVSVTVRSLNPGVPYEETTTTAGGAYAFNNAPAGVQIEITVTRPGYGSRRRVEILKSNKQGDPNANKYDFGPGGANHNGTINNGLSDLPEVIAVVPERNASGVRPDTSIVLTFSEPMDRDSVEAAFGVFQFIADQPELVLDIQAFFPSWNHDSTELTLSLKGEHRLGEEISDYLLSFKPGQPIRDQSGVGRVDNYFKLSEGPHENGSRFSIAGFATQMLANLPEAEPSPLPPPQKLRDSFYFSYDDSASVASVELFKHALENGRMPQREAARTWEFLNYEKFDHINQQSTGQFQVSLGLWRYADPHNPYTENYEVGVHVTAPYHCRATRRPLNLTVLVDASTSMDENSTLGTPEGGALPKKLELVKYGLKQMFQQLKDGDVLNLMIFSNKSFVELEGFVVGQDPEQAFMDKVAELKPLWGTHLQQGLTDAYRLAQKYHDKNRLNRLLLLTDAHATEGQADLKQISQLASQQDQAGIHLSALGLGHDHNAALLHEMTEAGRGAYYTINTQTDMREAMGDRFLPMMDVIARNMRFQLEFPGWMRHAKSAAEELSGDPNAVQPTNFSANTSQYFWEQFRANRGDYQGADRVRLTLSYQDPLSGASKTEVLEKSLSEMLDRDLSNIKAAHLIQLSTALVRGELSAAQVQQELHNLLPDTGQ